MLLGARIHLYTTTRLTFVLLIWACNIGKDQVGCDTILSSLADLVGTGPVSKCDDELYKECHCGSIAKPPGISLFTRDAYPNSSTEEYDEEIPYGHNYRVYYRCTDAENVLVGNNMRECLKGNWMNSVPRCGECSKCDPD